MLNILFTIFLAMLLILGIILILFGIVFLISQIIDILDEYYINRFFGGISKDENYIFYMYYDSCNINTYL